MCRSEYYVNIMKTDIYIKNPSCVCCLYAACVWERHWELIFDYLLIEREMREKKREMDGGLFDIYLTDLSSIYIYLYINVTEETNNIMVSSM